MTNPFAFSWTQVAIWGGLTLAFIVLLVWNKLPQMRSFKDFLDAINSAGGHIFLLALFSFYFFKTAMQLFYHTLNLPEDFVSKHEALIAQGYQFVTGMAFGGAWAALLKTMTGAKANGAPASETPVPDKLDVNSVPPATTPQSQETKR